MSLAQVADLAYVILTDRVEARATTDRVLTGLARTMGGTVDLVSVEQALADFDEALCAEPAPVDDRDPHRMLLRELGVGS